MYIMAGPTKLSKENSKVNQNSKLKNSKWLGRPSKRGLSFGVKSILPQYTECTLPIGMYMLSIVPSSKPVIYYVCYYGYSSTF